jgi:autotransporter-associated beta strand protein
VHGSLVGSSASFRKRGAGTLAIADSSAFAGSIFVEAGVLALDGLRGGSGGILVSADGTLTGALAGTAPIVVSGTIAPGNGAGVMGTGTLAFSGGALSLELASSVLYDQLSVTGAVSLEGTVNLTLNLLEGFDPADNADAFTVIANDGADAIGGAGRFAFDDKVLDEGELFYTQGQTFRLSYIGGTGNDVVFFAVPEPSSGALLAAAGLALVRRRNRARR